jgi:hypothetical protein
VAWLYLLILIVVAAALWAAYRVLGAPSRLAATDYEIVLQDIVTSVERAAGRLRSASERETTAELERVATDARKIFQTGYYQTLRLRPDRGPDAADARAELGRACEAYEWASRMLGSESGENPLVLDAARRLLDAGDLSLSRASLGLRPRQLAAHESTPPSTPARPPGG